MPSLCQGKVQRGSSICFRKAEEMGRIWNHAELFWNHAELYARDFVATHLSTSAFPSKWIEADISERLTTQ
ncbi:hypothetical protein DTO212C5_1258 [Paecilomyces variotii]|nr:hypothetical protein DTO212C5_1258 [Paecilomyces variotii]